MRPWRLTPPRATENDIEAGCLGLLRLRGYWPIRLHAGRFKTADNKRWITGVDKGTPDWAAVHRRFPAFLLEVKRPGELLQTHQLEKIREIQSGYGLAIVVTDDPHELLKWLDAHENRFRTSPEISKRTYEK